jgi:Acetyltransferase (GNAT) domain
VLVGWTHPYAPLGAPLVDRELSEPVIAAWLAHVARDPRLPGLVLLPYFPADGELAQALAAVLARRGGRSAAFARHQRALLLPGEDRDRYLDEAIAGKKRKELRRQRKRLAESGIVTAGSAPIGPALEQFFTLEAGGWKGRAGTAARENAAIAGFVTAALTALAGEGKARISLMRVGGRPIAALVTLRSGASAWCWKIAYDEGFARFSPGVQLVIDVTHMLLDDATVARADSCATADHPMIDHIWRERLALEDRLLCVGPDKSFGLACALEAVRRAVIGAARATRDAVRS